jgi:phosphoglycolate phosphatase-like HAD superfamily hydrolase
MDVRERGFRKIFSDQDPGLVQKLIDFHNQNGGISRFYKIRYFHEELLGIEVSEEEVNMLAELFSKSMRDKLNDPKRLIMDTLDFIIENYQNLDMHIVSGSEKEELNWLCKQLEVGRYFKSVEGSPTAKPELVSKIIQKWKYKTTDCVLIGDSINDYDAAKANGIEFFGFNNPELKKLDSGYIDSFLDSSPFK